jgi:hypothetical protein
MTLIGCSLSGSIAPSVFIVANSPSTAFHHLLATLAEIFFAQRKKKKKNI